jgi:hypothetical protein
MSKSEKYNELTVQGKRDEAAKLHTAAIDECMHEAEFTKSEELQTILDNIIAKEKEKNPYFPHKAPFAEVKKDGESIDALLMSSKYEIRGCLLSFYRELQQHEIDTLFRKADCDIKELFKILKKPLHIRFRQYR